METTQFTEATDAEEYLDLTPVSPSQEEPVKEEPASVFSPQLTEFDSQMLDLFY